MHLQSEGHFNVILLGRRACYAWYSSRVRECTWGTGQGSTTDSRSYCCRVYTEGAVLRDHVDVSETHHVSAIINIDQVTGWAVGKLAGLLFAEPGAPQMQAQALPTPSNFARSALKWAHHPKTW